MHHISASVLLLPSSSSSSSSSSSTALCFLRLALIISSINCIVAANIAGGSGSNDCHGKICHPVEEFCSAFLESCDKCANICDATSHNYHLDMCSKECADYNKYEPLKAEIHTIQIQQNIILVLLAVLLSLIVTRYAYKCIRWLREKGCITNILKKLQPKKHRNEKDLGATTIPNVMAINDMERAQSQIYSVTGAEGSVMTMTTPVSTRYPAENSTTPTTEYSYDNQALAVTPVTEKPNSGVQVF